MPRVNLLKTFFILSPFLLLEIVEQVLIIINGFAGQWERWRHLLYGSFTAQMVHYLGIHFTCLIAVNIKEDIGNENARNYMKRVSDKRRCDLRGFQKHSRNQGKNIAEGDVKALGNYFFLSCSVKKKTGKESFSFLTKGTASKIFTFKSKQYGKPLAFYLLLVWNQKPANWWYKKAYLSFSVTNHWLKIHTQLSTYAHKWCCIIGIRALKEQLGKRRNGK